MSLQNDANYDRMSMVPLMNQQDRRRRSQHDQFVNDPDWSDQEIDEFTQDPLENVLMQMRLWPQAITRHHCVRSAVFTGAIGLCLGFLMGYLLFMLLYTSSVCFQDFQRDVTVETKFMDHVDSSHIYQYFKNFAEESAVPGSSRDEKLVKYISFLWAKQGLDYVSVVPYKLVLVQPDWERSSLVEVINENDSTVFSAEILPANQSSFNSSSTITKFTRTKKGLLLHLLYGRSEDYEPLIKSNVEVQDSIALIRLGKISLYQKLKIAQKNNISAILLYPDPKEQAPNGHDEIYLKNFWIPESAVKTEQFGLFSKDDLFNEEGSGLTRIPVQIINYTVAEKLAQFSNDLLSSDDGKALLEEKSFKSKKSVSVMINSIRRTVTVKNIIGVINGTTEQDRYVLIGNHRDSLYLEGGDFYSGNAVLLELSHGFTKLLKGGWRPKRTILFCSWSVGAYGPVGSSHWTEEFSKLLSERAVAYLNLNVIVEGNQTLQAVGVPLLYQLLYDVTKTVTDPTLENQKRSNDEPSVYHNLLSKLHDKAKSSKISDPLMDQDYSPFIHHLGIPVLEIRYTGISNESVNNSFVLHHTDLDDFHHLEESAIDSKFKLHKSIAQMYGLLLIRLADSTMLPFHVGDYSKVLETRLQSLKDRVKDTPDLNKDLNLESLDQAIRLFKKECSLFETELNTTHFKNWQNVQKLNDRLLQVEKSFIRDNGLSCIPEFNHVVFSYDVTHSMEYSFPCLDILLQRLVASMASSSYKQTQSYREIRENITREVSALVFAVQSATFTLHSLHSLDFSRNLSQA